jgi:hypothetical protein
MGVQIAPKPLRGGDTEVTKSENEGMIAKINSNQLPFVARGHVPRRNDNQAINRMSTTAALVGSIPANDTAESAKWNFLLRRN